MKIFIITLSTLAMTSVTLAADAVTSTDWTVINGTLPGSKVYTSEVILGNFNITLDYDNKPIIDDNESFSLRFTMSSDANNGYEGFANAYGTGLIGTASPYTKDGLTDDNQFNIYVGHDSGAEWSEDKVELYINGSKYTVDGYTYNPLNDNNSDKLTLDFQILYQAGETAQDTKLIFSSCQSSDVQFTTMEITGITKTLDFATLTNYGEAYDGSTTSITVDAPKGASTLITITTNIPEPATATLSLLALAGLAARRRRK